MLDSGKCRCSRHVVLVQVSSCLLYFMYLLDHCSGSQNSVLLPGAAAAAVCSLRAEAQRSLPRAAARRLADKGSAEGA